MTKDGKRSLKLRLLGFAGGSIGCAILIVLCLGFACLIITIIPRRYWFPVSSGMALLVTVQASCRPKGDVATS